MRNRRLALAAALLLAITSADGAALAVSGADFSSEEVAEAVFDEVENEGLDNQDEVQEPVQTPEMDQVEDQSSEDSFSDASGMEAAAEWQNEEAATADEALVFSDGEDTGITYTLSDDGKLVISGTGSIADDAFAGNTKITSVVISEGVTGIGSRAFTGCTNLTSLTSIGNDAFKNCAKLRSIRCYANSSTWQPRYICDSNTTVYYSYNPNHTHSYKSHVIKMSGCTYSGSEEEICEFCGDYYTKETPALGHDWNRGETTEDASCESDGEKTYTCRRCGDKKKETIPATGHSWVRSWHEDATCTDDGVDEYTCRYCDTEKRTTIKATGHKFSAWAVTQEATVDEEEVQTRTCSACGEQETKITRDRLQPTMKLNQSSIVLKTRQKTKCLKVTGLAKGDFISTWSTDNWSIADVSVSSDGTCNITAGKTTGKTRIHIYLNSGYEKSVTVKVQKTAVKTTKIKGVPKTLKLMKNQKYSLKPVLKPVTSKEKITYKSSSSKVVKVDSKGRITAKKKGTAVITVKAGKKTVKCKVTVK